MDDLLLGLLWFGIVAGSFAILGLLAEAAEWFADSMDAWVDSFSENYIDD